MRAYPRCSVGWRIALLPPVEILVAVGIAMDQAHQLPPLSVRAYPRCSVGWRIALLPPVEILVAVGIALDQAHQLPPLSVTYRNWCPAITETPVPFLRNTQLGDPQRG